MDESTEETTEGDVPDELDTCLDSVPVFPVPASADEYPTNDETTILYYDDGGERDD
jgi:hypothetical protein